MLRREAVGGSELEKKQTGKMDGGRFARSVSVEVMGNLFFFPFSSPFYPPFISVEGGGRGGRLAYQEREERFCWIERKKKAFDEKESTCTQTLDIPPCSRAQIVVCMYE